MDGVSYSILDGTQGERSEHSYCDEMGSDIYISLMGMTAKRSPSHWQYRGWISTTGTALANNGNTRSQFIFTPNVIKPCCYKAVALVNTNTGITNRITLQLSVRCFWLDHHGHQEMYKNTKLLRLIHPLLLAFHRQSQLKEIVFRSVL
jgi:hypothetical protein